MRTTSWAVALALVLSPRLVALDRINDWRAREGCRPVQVSTYAMRQAVDHSRWMEKRDTFEHSTDLDMQPGFTLGGEVIGVGDSVRQLVRALHDSPEHYALLTDCRYDIGGFGVARDDRVWLTGRFYAT